VVLCPGVNDGPALEQTLAELSELYPTVQTVSVVPVGASPKLETWSLERDGIPIQPATPAFARAVVATVSRAQKAARRDFGRSVAHCSDEFYLTAGLPVPGAAIYDGFAQYENGIGMVRKHRDDWARTRRRVAAKSLMPGVRSIAVGTGKLAEPVLTTIAGEFAELTGIRSTVVGVENTVFGSRVNVAGLVNGCDWRAAFQGCDADILFLPRTSLDYFGERFLDGVSTAEMEAAVGKPVVYASQWSEIGEYLTTGASLHAPGKASNGAMWSVGRDERFIRDA
jgi:NifB/MoaA-like Fe-S oxidoreductase